MENDPRGIFIQKKKLGSPRKVTREIIQRVEELTLADRRMTDVQVAQIIKEHFTSVCPETIRQIRKSLGFFFERPVRTFCLTPVQKANRLAWCQNEQRLGRDWSKVFVTDESYFWLGDDGRPLWRRRGERGPDVQVQLNKFPKKLMVFAGFSMVYKSAIILITHGTVTAESYVDDLIDQSGLIPDLNNIYGARGWTFMQDGASAHTAASTMDYLRLYCDVLEDWPSGSPDLNPIENVWALMKRKVGAVQCQSIEDLGDIIIETWNSITQQEMTNLMMSMPTRIQATIDAQGGPNGY
jgi:transposase